MQKHTKIYFDYFSYDISSYVPCEICGGPAVDVHHIDCKGMGGDPLGKKEVIENLMGLCRHHHDKYGDLVDWMDYLIEIHLNFMKNNG